MVVVGLGRVVEVGRRPVHALACSSSVCIGLSGTQDSVFLLGFASARPLSTVACSFLVCIRLSGTHLSGGLWLLHPFGKHFSVFPFCCWAH